MRVVKKAPLPTLLPLCAALMACLSLLVASSPDAQAAWRAPAAVTSGTNVVHSGKASTVADSSGNVTAVWSELSSGRYSVFASRYAGGAWGSPVMISDPLMGDATQSTVVVDSTGAVTAMWIVASGANNIITAATQSTRP